MHRRFAAWASSLLLTFSCLFCIPPVLAGGVGLTIPAPPDSMAMVPGWFDFVRVKPMKLGTFRFRDLEVWLDGMYLSPDSGLGATMAQTNTLDRYGKVLADTAGINPFDVASTDIRLVHDYFRPDTAPAYSTNPYAPYGFRVGEPRRRLSSGDSVDVSNEDRGHIDLYLTKPRSRFVPDLGWYTGWGQYPALFRAEKEDSSTGHWYEGVPADSLYSRNTLTVAGPDSANILWRSGSDWAAPNANANWDFNHEFQHSLDGVGDVTRNDRAWLAEVFSAGAELLAGNTDKVSNFDVDYSLSLHTGKNYPAWRLFSAYLGVNFLGRDTSHALSGLQDDLLGRWARRQPRSMASLRDLLANSECYDCSTKVYFNPPGLPPIDNAQRLRLLLHGWRVANYLNRTDLAEGRYGYRPGFDFSPFLDVRPWENADGDSSNDLDVIPPTLIITPDLANRPLSLTTRPPDRTLTIVTYGAEYWVMRADEALAVSNLDLVVRVTPVYARPAVFLENEDCLHMEETLMGSVIPYTQHRLTGGGLDSLWRHPEWAGVPAEPISVIADSMAGPLEFVIPGFGSTTKACVLVLSVADGPSQGHSVYGKAPQSLIYRLTVSLRQPSDTVDVSLVARHAGVSDDQPTWSPPGDSIAFASTIASQSNHRQIYQAPVTGGSPVRLFPQTRDQSAPDWSPRGDWIVFEAETVGTTNLWLRSTRSTTSRKLSPTDAEHRWPAFRPDGQRIAYSEVGRILGGQITTRWQIRSINVDGTGDTALTELLTEDPIQSLRWTPDGSRILFTRNDSLFTLSAIGGTPVYKASKPPMNYRRRIAVADPHPIDGRFALEEIGAVTGKYVCNLNGDQVSFRRISTCDTVLPNDAEACFFRRSTQFFSPRWSPDGLRIAYSSDQNAPDDRDVFIGRVSYNHAPTFTSAPPDTGLPADVPYSRSLRATDADGQTLTYLAHYLPSGASMNGGTFSWPSPVAGTYYIVFRVHDGTGGVASKVVRFTVTGGGGGGCPFIDTRTASGWVTENSVLARATDGVPRLDAYRLKYVPQAKDGRVTLRLRENEQEYTALDQVRLVALDHAPSVRAFAAGEQVWLGTRVPAVRVTDQHGTDVTARVDGEGADFYQGEPGDTLWVSMTGRTVAGATGAQQVLEGGGVIIDDGEKGGEGGGGGGGGNKAVPAGAEDALATHDLAVLAGTGILIQAPDGGGDWRTVEHRYPRESFDEHVLDSLDTGELRLVFIGRHQVRFIGRLSGAERVTPTVLPLRSASHSRLGDALSAVSAAAGTGTALTPGDTLTLQFEVPAVPEGQVRDLFVLGLGTYSTSRAALRGLPPEETVALPVAYALGQNQPNPFRGSTTIRFALPMAGEVRLEVFDLQGRRVATLAQGRWEAGYHAVEWSQRSDRGRRVEPGVYLYRLTAGTFRDQRKLVLLP